MKNIDEFLSHLRILGVKLWADGDDLRYSAHRGTLSPDLSAELSEHKAEILMFLLQTNPAEHSTLPPIKPVSRGGDLG